MHRFVGSRVVGRLHSLTHICSAYHRLRLTLMCVCLRQIRNANASEMAASHSSAALLALAVALCLLALSAAPARVSAQCTPLNYSLYGTGSLYVEGGTAGRPADPTPSTAERSYQNLRQTAFTTA